MYKIPSSPCGVGVHEYAGRIRPCDSDFKRLTFKMLYFKISLIFIKVEGFFFIYIKNTQR